MSDEITRPQDALAMARHFQPGAAPRAAEPLGSGHIHATFKVCYAERDTDRDLVLQQLNEHVFPDLAGVMANIARAIAPIMHWLFPAIPKDHPAISAMILNMSANVLGLGNAATPFGLKAMQELQKINANKAVATDAMAAIAQSTILDTEAFHCEEYLIEEWAKSINKIADLECFGLSEQAGFTDLPKQIYRRFREIAAKVEWSLDRCFWDKALYLALKRLSDLVWAHKCCPPEGFEPDEADPRASEQIQQKQD